MGRGELSCGELWDKGRGDEGAGWRWRTGLWLEEHFSLSHSLSRLSSRITREISCSGEAGSSLEANSSCNLSDNPLLKKLTSTGSFYPILAAKMQKSIESI